MSPKIWFGHDSDGYEQIGVPYKDNTVSIHQLTSIADGADPYKVWSDGEYVTHHKNNIPWDNRPNNLKVVAKGEHNRIHKPREQITKKDCKHIRDEITNSTLTALANEYGIQQSAISKHVYGGCSHFEEPAQEKRDIHRGGPWTDKSHFKKLYVELGYTLQEMAAEWSTSQSTMSKWKRRHGL